MTEVNLNRPISQSQFYRLSRNDQVKYVSSLVSTYGASGTMIADMLNMSGVTLRNHMATLGYHFSKGGRRSSEQLDEWDIFCKYDKSKEIDTGSIIYNIQDNKTDNNTDDSVESLKMFVEECCKINDDMNTRVDIFIQVYLAWCRDNDFPPMKKEDIIKFITSEYNAVFPKRKGHVYCNICLSYDKFQLYKNKIKYHDGEDRRTINPYMTFAKDNKEAVVQKSTKVIDEPKKNEDKPVVVEPTKSEPKSMKMTGASGLFSFEGNGEDIFKDLIERFKGDNIRVKVSWELII